MPTTESKPAAAKPRRWVEQLGPGERIDDQIFLVSKKDLRTTTNGSLYIHLVLADRSGQVLSRVWQATQPQFDAIPEGGFLRVRGRTESYKGSLQFIVEAMRSVAKDEIDLADFIPRTKHDVEQMWKRVVAIVQTIQHPALQKLLAKFTSDAAFVEKFKSAPAAVTLHHAYLGGLLEHTLSVLDVATRLFGRTAAEPSHYPQLSRDLVLAGVFLHDIGKTIELEYGTSFTYSDAGQLVGHIVQAAVMIDQKIADVETETGERFPSDLQNVLTHIVLAHHGSLEFGSPRLPAIPEAIAVHFLDTMDAKINMFLQQIESDADAESHWTQWVNALSTRVFKPDVMGIRGNPEKR
ncbi:MAG: HD domain-containing protein [Phycisphaerae bacterium]|nr:HD domain-containing protein [Phycisphaerae bacterium]